MADQVVQDIKDRLDIAEVISGYVQLKKAGTNFKGLCPFHNEKTPSFVVTPSRQIWHCFGCGEGGDVFTFVQKFENLDFPQTLKLLAERAGVKLPEYRPAGNLQEDEKELLVRINTFAARFYHKVLFSPQGKEALSYLTKRGLKNETIVNWQIGFAPNDFHSLSQALQKKKVAQEQAIKAGVVVKNEKGAVYDRFRGRVTFPVYNYVGEMVGFSARVLPAFDDGKTGKYINSPETAIYNKSKVLFGLNFAKNFVRKADEVIIVEGQMDCISAHQAGFFNTIASSGTAFTDEHLKILGRLTKNLKFCLDSDQAGFLATKRAVEHILGKDFNIKIVEIGAEAKDPDELIRKNPKAWEAAVKNASMFFDYYIGKLFSSVKQLSIESKKKIRDEVLPLIKRLSDALEREHYIKFLAPKLDTTPTALLEDMNKLGKALVFRKEPLAQNRPIRRDGSAEAEKLVLGGMLSDPKFLNKILTEGEIGDFHSPELLPIIGIFFNKQPVTGAISASTVAKEAMFMVELLKEESASTEAFQKDLTNAFFALRAATLKARQESLQAAIRRAEAATDNERVMGLQKEFSEVSKLISKYKF